MSYIRIWVHFVWGTKDHRPLLGKIKDIVCDHIRSYASQKGIYLDCINGSDEHLHALISLKAGQNMDKIAMLIKGESSFWINKMKLIPEHFEWSDEYFAISVSGSLVPTVRRYIENQEEHHRKRGYQQEYEQLLQQYKSEQ